MTVRTVGVSFEKLVPDAAHVSAIRGATGPPTPTNTHELSHMDLLDLLDDYLLVHLFMRGGLACLVSAWQLNRRTKRLCSIEIQARLPALKALTRPPFEISLAQSFGIAGGTKWVGTRRGITDSDMAAFSFAVSRGALASLKLLSFGGNPIGDEGMITFADAIKPTEEIPMGALASVTMLSLSGNQIGDEGIKAFSSALRSGAMGSLQKLWLHGNQIGDGGMIAFAEALKPNSNFPMGALASLKELYLQRNQFGHEGMKAFCTAISSGAMGSLQQLWLHGNQIGDGGMIAFAEALKANSNFPVGSLPNFVHFDISYNQIGDTGMIAFADAIKPTDEFPMGSLASLEDLRLWDNTIGDKGMKAFSSALSSGALASLQRFYLDDETMGALHPALNVVCEARGIDWL